MKSIIIFSTLSIFLIFQKSYAQYSYGQELYNNLLARNSVTLHNENNEKEVFHVLELKLSPDSKKSYYWYAANKITKTQGGYAGKLLHGNYQKFIENDILQEYGQFKKGLKTGQWKEWYSNGRLKKVSQWQSGEENGRFEMYDDQGNITAQGALRNGLRQGKIEILQENDSTFQYQYFNEGNLISEEEYIHTNFFRKTGQFIKTTWKKIFTSKIKEETP